MPARSHRETDTQFKIVDWERLETIREQLRLQAKTIVWTNGCFDLLHVGHIRSLQSAASLGDLLVVGLNSDASVRQLKGVGRPVASEQERAIVLSALACVDYVVVFDELTPESAIRRLRPDIHCKGADYAPPNGRPIPEAEVVRAYGGRIEFIPLLPTASTTDLVRRIQQQGAADGG